MIRMMLTRTYKEVNKVLKKVSKQMFLLFCLRKQVLFKLTD